MTHGITWRTAGTVEKKRDAVAMRTFTCATPRSGDKYPPDFEDEVQRHFRQRAITAANTARDRGLDGRLRIAEDSQGIAAAFSHRRLDHTDPAESKILLDIPASHVARELCFLAVAVRHRNQNGTVADEAVIEALWDIRDQEPAAERIWVLGRVDYRNKASMRMLQRHSFREVTRGEPPPKGDQRLGWWLRVLDQQPTALF